MAKENKKKAKKVMSRGRAKTSPAAKKASTPTSTTGTPTYKTVKIHSLEEFIAAVTNFKKDKNYVWYRGHCSNKYVLQPSIYRDPFSPDDEDFFISKFVSKSIPFLSTQPQRSNAVYWEWLFLMQHYKIPTRLLDWTESALIGLAFAVMFRRHEDKDIKGTGAHIWCIDPVMCNSSFRNLSNVYVPNITENEDAREAAKKTTDDTNKVYRPVAIFGPQNSSRIVGQKGAFTVFPNNFKFSFDDHISDDALAVKLEIPSAPDDKYVRAILQQLYIAGITESIVFPELDSVSTEIVNELTGIKANKK